MSTLPRVRWLAALLAIAFGIVFAGLDFDLSAALAHLGTQAAAIAATLLALAKLVREAIGLLDERSNPAVYTQNRGGEPVSLGVRLRAVLRAAI